MKVGNLIQNMSYEVLIGICQLDTSEPNFNGIMYYYSSSSTLHWALYKRGRYAYRRMQQGRLIYMSFCVWRKRFNKVKKKRSCNIYFERVGIVAMMMMREGRAVFEGRFYVNLNNNKCPHPLLFYLVCLIVMGMARQGWFPNILQMEIILGREEEL